MAIEPPSISLSKDSERAVLVVFEACRVTGASLVTAHRVAAMVAEELEKIERVVPDPSIGPPFDSRPTPYQRAHRAYIASCIAFAVSAVAVVLALIAVAHP